MKRSEAGNVLFLILIAVVLFAALSYVVTSSTRVGGLSTSREFNALAVGSINNYFSTVQVAVDRLIAYGAPIQRMSFDSPYRVFFSGAVAPWNNSSCTSPNCEVFSNSGGGAVFQTFDKYGRKPPYPVGWTGTSAKPGYDYVYIFNVRGIGSDLNDIAMVLRFVDLDVCKKWNQTYGLPEIITDTGSSGSWFTYRSGNPANIDTLSAAEFGVSNSAIFGKNTFCLTNTTDNYGDIV